MFFQVGQDFVGMCLVEVFAKGLGVAFDKCDLHPVVDPLLRFPQ